MTEAAKETWVLDEPEGSPIGVLLDLPNGAQIWSGEASRALFEEQGDEAMSALGGDDHGIFVMSSARNGTEIVCRAASVEHGIAIAQALAKVAMISNREG